MLGGWFRPATAQMTVVQITQGSRPITSETDAVLYTPLGAMAGRPIRPGLVVGADEELRSTDAGILLSLSCGPQVTFTLSGRFRVVVQPPDGERTCLLSLQNGVIDVVGDSNSAIRVGLLHAGATRTQYTVGVELADGQALSSMAVFEGEIAVTRQDASRRGGERGSRRELITPGTIWQFTNAGMQRSQPIPAEFRNSAADRFARIAVGGVSTLPEDQRDRTLDGLRTQYQATLMQGDDPVARLALAMRLSELDSRAPDRLYQVRQLATANWATANWATANWATGSPLAVSLWLEGVTWSTLGDSTRAGALLNRAMILDSMAVSRLVRSVPLDPRVLRGIERWPP